MTQLICELSIFRKVNSSNKNKKHLLRVNAEDVFCSYYAVGGNPWKTSVAIVKPPKITAAPRLNKILKTFRCLNAWTVPTTAKIAMSPKMTINKFIGKTLLSTIKK